MKINYRPEIDGLRAIAVGLVIIYHAELNIFDNILFKGGFIGVDIFFVISGYLITSIILKELNINNTFSFKHFYERRIRRIVPVIIFIALTCIPFSFIFLSPIEFVDFSKSVLYSIGFTSNLYFYFSDQEYAALSGLYKPFLHTWSLSVEEQYYLFFPLFFFLIFKYFKKYILVILIVFIICSLFLAEYGSRNFESLNFYILPTRMWELLLGSVLALTETKNKIPNIKFINYTFPLLGILLILFSAVYFDHDLRHPSLYTLIPVIGVCMIISFSNKNEILNKILSSKIFVGMGLISYSLYLWHYPVFAFGRITEITSGDIIKKIFLGLIILILSILSYFFLEKPFRNKNNDFKKILYLLFFLFLIVLIFYSSVIFNKGFKDRMPLILQNVTMQETHKLIKNKKNEDCLGQQTGCVFNPSSNKKIYIIGDSHAASLSMELKKKFDERNYQFTTYLLGDCGFFPGFNLTDLSSNKIDKNCNDAYFKKLQNELLNNQDAIIIFSSRLPLYLENREFNEKNGNGGKKWDKAYISRNNNNTLKKSFKDIINKLSQDNKIILVYPIPEFHVHVPKRLFSLYLKRKIDLKKLNSEQFITIPNDVYIERTNSSFQLLDSFTSKNVFRVYPNRIFCDNLIKDKCISHDETKIYYFDSNHLSIDGSKIVTNLILSQINNINNINN